MSDELLAYLCGAAVVVAAWAFAFLLTGYWNPLQYTVGTDGRLSSSKTQFLLWTATLFFSYTAIYVQRAAGGQYDAINEIPRNVTVALGLSASTLVAAKGISVGYVASGWQPNDVATTSSTSDLVKDDAGYPAITKIQMLGWTLIAIGIYLTTVVHRIHTSSDVGALPDIDGALVVLMGLAQGTYVGKKLVTVETPRLTQASPSSLPAGAGGQVTLSGTSFGANAASGMVTLDGEPLPAGSWSDSQIVCTVPANRVAGGPWLPGVYKINLVLGGQSAANELIFTLT